jgi:hypothetical protein
MKTLLAGLAAALLSACAPASPPAAVVRAETHLFADGGGARARVSRAIHADGAEVLHGETDLPGSRLRLVEDARLDPGGRLSRAEIRLIGEDGATRAHLVADRSSGSVRRTDALGASAWTPPLDGPWAVEPPTGVGPVAAWLARRAAESGEPVRVIRADAAASYLAPAEQVAIPTETGATVVLGESAGEADGVFLRRVRSLAGPLDLVRVEPAALAAVQ